MTIPVTKNATVEVKVTYRNDILNVGDENNFTVLRVTNENDTPLYTQIKFTNHSK